MIIISPIPVRFIQGKDIIVEEWYLADVFQGDGVNAIQKKSCLKNSFKICKVGFGIPTTLAQIWLWILWLISIHKNTFFKQYSEHEFKLSD